MDHDASRGLGDLALGGMSYLGKVFRDDHALIRFDEEEKDHFAKVLARFIYVRASYLGAASDVTALLFVGGMMVTKVATAETPPAKSSPASNGGARVPSA